MILSKNKCVEKWHESWHESWRQKNVEIVSNEKEWCNEPPPSQIALILCVSDSNNRRSPWGFMVSKEWVLRTSIRKHVVKGDWNGGWLLNYGAVDSIVSSLYAYRVRNALLMIQTLKALSMGKCQKFWYTLFGRVIIYVVNWPSHLPKMFIFTFIKNRTAFHMI